MVCLPQSCTEACIDVAYIVLDICTHTYVHVLYMHTVSPDAIHEHVKTKTEETNRLHYAAPELATAGATTAADIYAFGICTLEVSHTA